MASLSLCMIVKNEEEVLERCLDCVKDITDEIIIVDTGSSDDTKNIAKRYTNHVYDFTWIDDFSAARNYSFSKATMDYIMWLDADDVIDEENQGKLKELIANLEQTIDMVYLRYDVAFDANDHPTLCYYRERIFKRSNEYKWEGEIHEVIPANGYSIYEEITITHRKKRCHDTRRNLKIFERMLLEGKTLNPRQHFYYARELKDNGYTERAIQEFTTFLDGGSGGTEYNICACADLAACYRLLQNDGMGIGALYRSFNYDLPRAEICCEIGSYFVESGRYEQAIYWYKLAAGKAYIEHSEGFYSPDCHGYTPNIQLCLCYDKIGDYETARKYNEIAGTYKPDDENVVYNRSYFNSIFSD